MNFWINKKKTARLAHLTYGCGFSDIHLPAVYPVTEIRTIQDFHIDVIGRIEIHWPKVIVVSSWFGYESDQKLIWVDEDLLILDGKHYQRNAGFFSVRERRLGVFFTLKEIGQ